MKRTFTVRTLDRSCKGTPASLSEGDMMERWSVVSGITAARVIGIIRSADRSSAVGVGSALLDAGLPVIEVALTTPGGLEAVAELAGLAGPGQLVGAGTVLDEETARLAIAAGAAFLVSPNLSPAVIRTAHRYGIPAIPGVATASEIVQALELGADLIKLFPASELGVGYLEAILSALPHAPLVPTGGVDAAMAPTWLRAGAVAVGVGGALTRGNPSEVRRLARELLAAVSGHAAPSD
jgi:2-dehydro-3-deoxyphosphogluconate aldolase / (4S)-4-hydroxy-2-oxoglutarate aldolase